MSRITKVLLIMSFCLILAFCARAQETINPPLPKKTIELLSNEISGQMIFNNEVILAGAPWLRNETEFTTGTLYEAQKIYDIVKAYGIETTRIDRYKRDRKFSYPVSGEITVLKPEFRRIARLEADPALIASGSESIDITGELIYLSRSDVKNIKDIITKSGKEKFDGKIALMWSHPRGSMNKALDEAGIKAVISYYSRNRYLDPDEVVYARGSYQGNTNLKTGFNISWRQWSELMEDCENGIQVMLHCNADIREYQDKFETVFSWIPGKHPDKKGVVFTAHLFEGYVKRGANDNMSGCVVQLEILRALTTLIKEGKLEQPDRNIYFVWPNEISGTFEQIKQNKEIFGKISININMDMVGEGLRKNNSLFTMSECPDHLPSYLDALSSSVLRYVWRTNDIVYLPDSPRSRRGGNMFPVPIVEKNGSYDAFRYFIHKATGGSDHICFNNPVIAIPGIEFFTWPDQWYHADTDTPDKSDPTEMKRVGFIGAAIAYAAANCTDEVLQGLLNEINSFGYERVAKRELAEAMNMIGNADSGNLSERVNDAYNLVNFGAEREGFAILSVTDIYSASKKAKEMTAGRSTEWEMYGNTLKKQVLDYGRLKAKKLGSKLAKIPAKSAEDKKYQDIVPAYPPEIILHEFSYRSIEKYQQLSKNDPTIMIKTGLSRNMQQGVLNFINGKRSVPEIKRCVEAVTRHKLPYENMMKFLEVMKQIGYITW